MLSAALLLVGLAVLAALLLGEGERVVGQASAIDGDSLLVGGVEVRLHGIDAPELAQWCRREGRDWPCGEEARRHLDRLVGRSRLDCRVREEDRFGRGVATCLSGEVDFGRRMVADGYAVAYGAYRREERRAKEARRGVWSGEFERPKEWRELNPRR